MAPAPFGLTPIPQQDEHQLRSSLDRLFPRRAFLKRAFGAGAAGLAAGATMSSPGNAAEPPGLAYALRRFIAARRRVCDVVLASHRGTPAEQGALDRAVDEMCRAQDVVKAMLGGRALAEAVGPDLGLMAILTRDGGWNEGREPGWPGRVYDPDPDYLHLALVPLGSIAGLAGIGGGA